MKKILIIIALIISCKCYAQVNSDSIYLLAWEKFNKQEYVLSGELFEKSIKTGKKWAGVYLNAASAWAYANNKEKTFENLFKMVDVGYVNKRLVANFPEFDKYHESDEWKQITKAIDDKVDAFNKCIQKADFQKLTKEQMYADFDTLVNTIVLYSPHLKVRQKVCGINFEKRIKSMRKEIATYNSSKQLFSLLYRVLLICQDGHTSLASQDAFQLLSEGLSMEECASIAKYERRFNSIWVRDDNLPKLIYFDGKYYARWGYRYGDISIPKKAELISVNGIQPTKYLSKNIDKKGHLSWDFKHKCFYSDGLLQSSIANDTTLRVTFLVNKKKQTIEVPLTIGSYAKSKSQLGKVDRPTLEVRRDGFVSYWEDVKTLYIRIPEMSDENFYLKELAKHKTEDIEKIIIDVRNNPGGSDDVWMTALSVILSDQIKFKIEYAYNSSLKGKDTAYVATKNFKDLDLVSRTVSGIDNEKSDSSLNYKGKIYVLYDEQTFSAAGSLVSECYYSDRMVAVGVRTGRILGFGTNPTEFRLPNTRINCRVESILDITNCKTYEAIFHDQPELDVNPSLDDKILLKENTYTTDFLRNKDPYLKKIFSEK